MLAVVNETRVDSAKPNPIEWLERHGDYLYNFALFRLRDEAVAEDIVQETLLAALQSYQNFSGGSSERTWLTGILKHKIIDYFRRTSRQVLVGSIKDEEDFSHYDENSFDELGRWSEDAAPSVWHEDPASLLERKEFQKVLDECLAEMPKKLAAVFTLREIEGLSTDEICETLSVTPNNLWVMLHRARTQLRRALEINWFNPRAIAIEPAFASELVAARN